jgi:hypothetical protein
MHFRTSCFILVACTIGSADLFAQQGEVITPVDAINRAAEAATNNQRFVRGVFEIVVQGTGRQDSLSYLNSEIDYRDQRSLTAAILPRAAPALMERYGTDFLSALKGKRIRITGAAQRVTIWFYCDGKRTEKYYFQTQIPIFRADQITVMDK